jgi:hypothetical protein
VVSSESGYSLKKRAAIISRHGNTTGYGESMETAFFPERSVIDPGKKQQYRRQYSAKNIHKREQGVMRSSASRVFVSKTFRIM